MSLIRPRRSAGYKEKLELERAHATALVSSVLAERQRSAELDSAFSDVIALASLAQSTAEHCAEAAGYSAELIPLPPGGDGAVSELDRIRASFYNLLTTAVELKTQLDEERAVSAQVERAAHAANEEDGLRPEDVPIERDAGQHMTAIVSEDPLGLDSRRRAAAGEALADRIESLRNSALVRTVRADSPSPTLSSTSLAIRGVASPSAGASGSLLANTK